MTGQQERVLSISIFITYILLSSTIVDAVTWRRVTRPTVKPQDLPSTTQKHTTLSTTKLTTKSPVIWRRSTVVRRSTDYSENEAHGDESDELNEASSEKKEDLKGLENDSEVKPLVPGSRPGFWFDSSRRKKPASLLRPGTRRNSLFPSRSSTTVAPTTASVTPVTVIPRTPPDVSSVRAKNASTKLFGRNKSTNSPVVFRRRTKTTRAPRGTSTTVSVVEESDESYEKRDKLAESRNDTETEKEREDVSKDLTNDNAESEDIEYKRPKFNIRRRPYNGTRLSWTRQRIQNKRTTTVPQQLTTAAPTVTTKDNERLLRKTTKFPRIRMKPKANATSASDITRTRSTAKPSSSNRNSEKSPTKTTPESTLENDYHDEVFEAEIISSDLDSEVNDFVEKPTIPTRENYGSRHTSKVHTKSKVRTTVEPFFITRDYGRVVTAFAEIKTKKESTEIVTTAVPIKKKDNEYEEFKDKKHIADAVHALRKDKKRTQIKATKAPDIITPVTESIESIEKEYETENDDIGSSFDYVDNFKSNFFTTTEVPVTTEESNEKFLGERLIASPPSTTRRPVTFPTIPPIDLNSNAYVVWSVGHGGSGWSYQKHGESVKWSAQNSEAEGDSWSVEAKDAKDTDFDNSWLPIRNATVYYQNNEKVNSTVKIRENWNDVYPVTYIPNVPFKNETILNFNRETDSLNFPQENTNDSFVPFNLEPNSAYLNNSTSLLSNFQEPEIQQPPFNSFVSQTPLPISPTLEDQFNAQVQGIINQYPVAPDYPYVSEIRETYKNIPTMTTKTPATKFYNYQDYATQNRDTSEEKLPVTPPSTFYEPQIIQDPQISQYVTNLEQDGIALPYNDFAKDTHQGIAAVNQLSPVNLPYQKHQPNIPPELAKAVVEAKKWQVIGSGGPEGWSLLNENGVLEWKIHSVDGKWKISSADELIKTENPVQQATYVVNNQNTQAEKHEYTNDLPKVWTLEDDYEKWRAVSAERGIPSDESSKEVSLSSQEYDYESDESDSDYYSDEDYYTSEPVSKESETYEPNNNYGSLQTWNVGENQRIQEQRKNPYNGNIEIANTRNDAIAAWKSLIAQQGHWKLSGDINERLSTYARPDTSYFQNRGENAEEGVSGSYQRRGNDLPEQKFQKIKQNIEKYRNNNRYQEQRNDYANDGQASTKQSLTNLKLQEKSRESDTLNYDIKNRNVPNEAHRQIPKVKHYVGYQDSLPDSTENYGNVFIEKFTADNKQENQQTRQKNEFNDQTYAMKRQDHKYEHNRNNHHQLTQTLNTRNNIAQKEFYVDTANPYAFDHSQSKIQRENDEKKKISFKNSENIFELHDHRKSKDHSKLDSLISKLEAIHRESQGRAVIDLTALLTRMKEKRNVTSTTLGHHSIQTRHHSQNISPVRSTHSDQSSRNEDSGNVLEILDKMGQKETKNAQGEDYSDSKMKFLGFANDNFGHNSNDSIKYQMGESNRPQRSDTDVKEHSQKNIQPQDGRLRHSMKSTKRRRRRPGSRLRKIRGPSSNQTSAVNENSYLTAKRPEESSYKLRSTTAKPEKIMEERNRYSKYSERPLQNLRSNDRDSSSSEEIYMNLRDNKEIKPYHHERQRKRAHRKNKNSHHPPPIVLKGETEIEDEEDGSKKSRKIIVIDYAGAQKKKSSVDKKDLELIIRNVKHRRSEIFDGSKEDKS